MLRSAVKQLAQKIHCHCHLAHQFQTQITASWSPFCHKLPSQLAELPRKIEREMSVCHLHLAVPPSAQGGLGLNGSTFFVLLRNSAVYPYITTHLPLSIDVRGTSHRLWRGGRGVRLPNQHHHRTRCHFNRPLISQHWLITPRINIIGRRLRRIHC
jgi:hypothetical protein